MKNLFRIYAQRKQNGLTGHQVSVSSVKTVHSPDPQELEKAAVGLSPHSMKWFLPLLPSDFESFCSCCVPVLHLLFAYLVFFLFASVAPSHCQRLCATPLSSWFAVDSLFCLKSPRCLHSLTQRYCVTNSVMIYRRPDPKFLNPVDYFKSHFTWFLWRYLIPLSLRTMLHWFFNYPSLLHESVSVVFRYLQPVVYGTTHPRWPHRLLCA